MGMPNPLANKNRIGYVEVSDPFLMFCGSISTWCTSIPSSALNVACIKTTYPKLLFDAPSKGEIIIRGGMIPF
jgi:hypothetical protein